MAQVKRYSPETRDRAIQMVVDHRGEYPSEWAAIQSVANKLGMTAERRYVIGCARPRSTTENVMG